MFIFNILMKMPGTRYFYSRNNVRSLLKSTDGVGVGKDNLIEGYRGSLWSLREGNTARLLQQGLELELES